MNYDAGEPILLIPCEGSAYRPTVLSCHPPNHLAFYYYLADNRYRCLTNNTTDNEQQQGPPVTLEPALSSRQSTRLPTRRTVSLPCLACFLGRARLFVA